jgi:toxin ParE1/3/4
VKLRVLDIAEAEVREAFDYYESQSSGLGRKLALEIQLALTAIVRHPEAQPHFQAKNRKRNLRRFPYGIFFRIEGEEVVFIAFFHLRSDPRTWFAALNERSPR